MFLHLRMARPSASGSSGAHIGDEVMALATKASNSLNGCPFLTFSEIMNGLISSSAAKCLFLVSTLQRPTLLRKASFTMEE
jgi:hypothetical protein